MPADGEITTDPALLRSIFTNLMDNAVTYAPRGGGVEVEAAVQHDRLTARVINTVEDLNESDLPLLFDRFWRKDPARTQDGHTGLGLALARTFAQAIGCQLTASFVAPGRLALTLAQTGSENSIAQQTIAAD